MKTTNRILLAAVFAALTSAGLMAQTTPPTPPGSIATGTTNSGGVAPATGMPTSTPTGPTAGGTGSGVTPVTPVAPPSPTVGGTTTPTTTTGGNTTTTPPGRSGGKGPNENASDTAKAVHAVIADFQKSRTEYLADRRKLLDAVKSAATAEARQEALEALRQDNQNRAAEERTLGKQIRDELRTLREARKSGGS